ncbi:MAG TPA: peptide chain release factor 1 [Patescibacteria group bacterium]|nr:peptide chain release factor 1 [Patescibacteria group bacterium]
MSASYQKILSEYDEISHMLAQPGADLATLGKRQAELEPTVEKIRRFLNLQQELADTTILLGDMDVHVKQMAEDDVVRIKRELAHLEEAIETDLLPKDPNDSKNIIMEIRAGAGGDESTLFGAELFRAYSKYAESLGMKVSTISVSKSDAGGFKEIIFEIRSSRNTGAYSVFKFESGVHRVQRVPETEKSGRVHTSTVTVAVLPEIEEKDFTIDMKDVEMEATTSSGHGGQSVNTTYSAIRMKHIPTGITAQSQDERSQAQNREKAFAVLRSRVAAHYREIEEKKIRDTRKTQVGTGDRSEKIRTYNFPQDRVTDHRINENFNQITLIMEGGLEPIITELQKAELELRKASLG